MGESGISNIMVQWYTTNVRKMPNIPAETHKISSFWLWNDVQNLVKTSSESEPHDSTPPKVVNAIQYIDISPDMTTVPGYLPRWLLSNVTMHYFQVTLQYVIVTIQYVNASLDDY